MPRLTLAYLVLSVVSGAVWGAIGYLLGRPAFPALIGPAVLASPLIGLVVGICFRWIHRLSRSGKLFVSLVSLYAAAALFGLALGFADLARDIPTTPGASRIPSAVVLQAVFAVWWGLTFYGYFLILWPLAYLNHRLLRRTLSQDRS
jgi:hypothetical protein